MMVNYTEEEHRLMDETNPWLAFDAEKEEFYIRDDAPLEIHKKRERLQKLLHETFSQMPVKVE